MLMFAPEWVGNDTPAPELLGIVLCAECKSTAKPTGILADEGWEQVMRGFDQVNRMRPDLKRTKLEWILETKPPDEEVPEGTKNL